MMDTTHNLRLIINRLINTLFNKETHKLDLVKLCVKTKYFVFWFLWNIICFGVCF